MQFDRSVTDLVHPGATSHRSRGPCTSPLGRRHPRGSRSSAPCDSRRLAMQYGRVMISSADANVASRTSGISNCYSHADVGISLYFKCI